MGQEELRHLYATSAHVFVAVWRNMSSGTLLVGGNAEKTVEISRYQSGFSELYQNEATKQSISSKKQVVVPTMTSNYLFARPSDRLADR